MPKGFRPRPSKKQMIPKVTMGTINSTDSKLNAMKKSLKISGNQKDIYDFFNS